MGNAQACSMDFCDAGPGDADQNDAAPPTATRSPYTGLAEESTRNEDTGTQYTGAPTLTVQSSQRSDPREPEPDGTETDWSVLSFEHWRATRAANTTHPAVTVRKHRTSCCSSPEKPADI
jgi:hypothetical protein